MLKLCFLLMNQVLPLSVVSCCMSMVIVSTYLGKAHVVFADHLWHHYTVKLLDLHHKDAILSQMPFPGTATF